MVAVKDVLSQLRILLEGAVDILISLEGHKDREDVLWFDRQDRHISNPQRIDAKDSQIMVNARLWVTKLAHLHRAGHVPGGCSVIAPKFL
jgi:hypothetical protein